MTTNTIISGELVQLSHKEFLVVDKDHKKAAASVHLRYVNDSKPGIIRQKKGKGFVYIYDEKPLRAKEQLERIRKLAIPPSWTNVWICPLENGHIQATGIDLRHRKQYRYHALWNVLRNETKFHRLLEFGKALPSLRLKIEKDLALPGLPEEKVLAAIISLMERTYIRIGNNGYEKLYGSYGLTTLKDKHVEVKGHKLLFSFTGKKGISHNISLQNKKLARIVKECRDIPGKELFQFYDETKAKKTIDSGMVNNYIKEATGKDFSAKDFRTWAGSLQALLNFQSIGEANTESERKKNTLMMLDAVSKKLGNSRTICKKYYVHPGLINLYEENKLQRYFKELDIEEEDDNIAGFTGAEATLLKILKTLSQKKAA